MTQRHEEVSAPTLRPLLPVDAAPVMGPLNAELVALLRGLAAEDWSRPATRRWTVREVASHILDTQCRRVSFQRDALAPLPPSEPITGFSELVRFLDGLNHVWVEALRRVSPRLLIELLELVGGRLLPATFAAVDPHSPAVFDVAWAGDERHPAWLDLGRELTEHWHHQQQIRLAVGAPLLLDPFYSGPVLETFLRALPRAYAGLERPAGTTLALRIGEPLQRDYALRRGAAGRWELLGGRAPDAPARVALDAETAWRVLTRYELTREQALRRIAVAGTDEELGLHLLSAVAVMLPPSP